MKSQADETSVLGLTNWLNVKELLLYLMLSINRLNIALLIDVEIG